MNGYYVFRALKVSIRLGLKRESNFIFRHKTLES